MSALGLRRLKDSALLAVAPTNPPMVPGEVRELVVGSRPRQIPSVRLLCLSPEEDAHEHGPALTLIRVVSGRIREIRYRVGPDWLRHEGGTILDADGIDYGPGVELLSPRDAAHRLLAVDEPAIVLEAHWPPLRQSLVYTEQATRFGVGKLLTKREWLSNSAHN